MPEVINPGQILPAFAEVAPEIAGDQRKPEAKAKPLTMSERSAMAQIKIAELRAAGLMRSPLEKFLDDPRPLRAIRRFCYECNGFSLAAATNCETSTCPLWLFRRGSGVIVHDELPTWKTSYSRWMKQAGELDRVSDDAESGADEVETLIGEQEC